MADKLTQQIIDALARVAAEPTGLPLYASKTDPGLFPNTAGAKAAAQKCLADELVRAVPADPKAKAARDRYALGEKGWEFLLAAVNPKQVLEDFVRVLEARQGEVGELLHTARRMADSLQGLRDAVARVLPGVTAARMPKPVAEREEPAVPLVVSRGPALPPSDPTTQPPAPRGEAESDASPFGSATLARVSASPPTSGPPSPVGAGGWGVESDVHGKGDSARHPLASSDPVPTAIALPSPPDLAPAVRAYLANHAGPTDCPLPELYRALARADGPTIGQFHDCLRQLHADGAVSFTAWAGPLYALPEPQYALLIGHGIAYYAAPREAGLRRTTDPAVSVA